MALGPGSQPPFRVIDGGGGDDRMLEARVGRLEDDMKEVKSDIKNIRDRLSRIEGEIARLPGYPGIAVIVGLIVALSTIAQIAAQILR